MRFVSRPADVVVSTTTHSPAPVPAPSSATASTASRRSARCCTPRGDGSEPLVQAWLTEVDGPGPPAADVPRCRRGPPGARRAPRSCVSRSTRAPSAVRSSSTSSPATRPRSAPSSAGTSCSSARRPSGSLPRRTGRYKGGYPGLAGNAWGLVLPELRTRGLDARVVALNPDVARTTLGSLLVDPTPRRCPTPVGTGRLAPGPGLFGLEDLTEALR